MSVHETLKKLQTIGVQKSKYNKFGQFNYRSLEDIYSAIKPHLNGCLLVVTDELVEVAGNPYIKSIVTLQDNDGNKVTVSGFAREEQQKPKFSPSQLTGTASTYARKYALQALLLLEEKDSDPDGFENKPKKQTHQKNVVLKENVGKAMHDTMWDDMMLDKNWQDWPVETWAYYIKALPHKMAESEDIDEFWDDQREKLEFFKGLSEKAKNETYPALEEKYNEFKRYGE